MTQERLIEVLYAQGITNEAVLSAIATTPREAFLSDALREQAYDNTALPIDCEQTISQPYIVALMTQILLEDGPRHTVLEIGTGSGYQAAILSQLVDSVYSVERIKHLHQQAQSRLDALALDNVELLYADGADGWAEHAPYDGILVTAAAEDVPQALLDQLAVGGRLVMPVGGRTHQDLKLIVRTPDGFETERLESVVFVPLLSNTEDARDD